MPDLDKQIRTKLTDLVEEMADFDDRSVAQYRQRYIPKPSWLSTRSVPCST